jgi:hypothetical protein
MFRTRWEVKKYVRHFCDKSESDQFSQKIIRLCAADNYFQSHRVEEISILNFQVKFCIFYKKLIRPGIGQPDFTSIVVSQVHIELP